MAEVAVFISIGADQAIAAPGKEKPPKGSVVCQTKIPGTAHKIRRTVVRGNGVLTGG